MPLRAAVSATFDVTAGFDEACARAAAAFQRLEVERIHDETYVLADGTRARTWLGAVEGSRWNWLAYGVFLRIHSAGDVTRVVAYVVGRASELEFLDKGSDTILAHLKDAFLDGAAR